MGRLLELVLIWQEEVVLKSKQAYLEGDWYSLGVLLFELVNK